MNESKFWQPPLSSGQQLQTLLGQILELLEDDPDDLCGHLHHFYNDPNSDWSLIGDKDTCQFTVHCGIVSFTAKGPGHVWADLRMDWTEVRAFLLSRLGQPDESTPGQARWPSARRTLVLRRTKDEQISIELVELQRNLPKPNTN